MFSKDAKNLMEYLIEAYNKTGKNEFDFINYKDVPNHESAISELTDMSILEKKNNILGTISINFDTLKN